MGTNTDAQGAAMPSSLDSVPSEQAAVFVMLSVQAVVKSIVGAALSLVQRGMSLEPGARFR